MKKEAGTRQNQTHHLFDTQATSTSCGDHPTQKHSKDESKALSHRSGMLGNKPNADPTIGLRHDGNKRRGGPFVEETVADNTPSITTEGEADEQKKDRCNSKLSAE